VFDSLTHSLYIIIIIIIIIIIMLFNFVTELLIANYVRIIELGYGDLNQES